MRKPRVRLPAGRARPVAAVGGRWYAAATPTYPQASARRPAPFTP